jgi:hypothetical protein
MEGRIPRVFDCFEESNHSLPVPVADDEQGQQGHFRRQVGEA